MPAELGRRRLLRAALGAAVSLAAFGAGVGIWYRYMHPIVPDFQSEERHEMALEDIKALLTDAGMEVTTVPTRLVIEADSLTQIVWQMNGDVRANGDARWRRGTKITLEYAVLVESLKNLTREAAVQRLRNAGVPETSIRILGRVTALDSEVGMVLEQRPDPGPPPIPEGGIVQLTVGVSDAQVQVQSWVGRDFCEARKTLGEQGLRVRAGADEAPRGSGGSGLVTMQDPLDALLRPGDWNDAVELRYSGEVTCESFIGTLSKIKTIDDFRAAAPGGGSP